jgi:hypothetical protein
MATQKQTFDLTSFIESQTMSAEERLRSPAKFMRQDIIGFIGETCGYLKDEMSYQRASNAKANMANTVEDTVELAKRMSIANAELAKLGL